MVLSEAPILAADLPTDVRWYRLTNSDRIRRANSRGVQRVSRAPATLHNPTQGQHSKVFGTPYIRQRGMTHNNQILYSDETR